MEEKKPARKTPAYREAPMVSWFAPGMIFQAAVKAAVSSLFGNYADKREMEAVLDLRLPATEAKEIEDLHESFKKEKELWFDFISDTGDGFNSTYSVAVTAAADKLKVLLASGQMKELFRGKILFLGGDQIYPTPTVEGYDQKFRTPFAKAFPKKEDPNDCAHMYAIPGNHDWYDGLGAFLKVFCQKRWTGNWATHQRRSYFAVPLPYNYWVWATDVQLASDIDEPQKQYFKDVAKNKMKQDDKVILITAEPAWIYHELYPESKSYERLQFFIQTYITEDKSECIGQTFDLVAVLTGDLHHFSHYCSTESAKPLHYIGAGGGGAFLHLTHNLPERLQAVEDSNAQDVKRLVESSAVAKDRLRETNIRKQVIFPEKTISQQMIFRNLLFFVRNVGFSFFTGILYLVVYWLIQSKTYELVQGSSNDASVTNYMRKIDGAGFGLFLETTGRILIHTPSCFLLVALFVAACAAFANMHPGKMKMWWWGLLHGMLQCFCIFLTFWALANLHHYSRIEEAFFSWEKCLIAAEVFAVGFLLGGMIMGFYFVLSNFIFDFHIDEASTALRHPHYKCFLRMHLDKEALTIYPIGIRKVTTNWQIKQTEDSFVFDGKNPDYELIGGKPITILHT